MHLERSLDRVDPSALTTLGLEPAELTRPDHTFTQQIGEAAHEQGAQAIRSPSATGIDEVLAIFPENLGSVTLQPELVDTWATIEDVTAE